LDFHFALTMLGGVREILGSGSIFDIKFVSEEASTILLFVMPPGAFIALGYLTALINKINKTS